MKTLIEEISDPKYRFYSLKEGIPVLKPDTYELKFYKIIPDEKGMKTLYLDTDLGMYISKSRSLLTSFYGELGEVIDKVISEGETIEIEVIDGRKINGRHGLILKTWH
jgi:hypothetical protein